MLFLLTLTALAGTSVFGYTGNVGTNHRTVSRLSMRGTDNFDPLGFSQQTMRDVPLTTAFISMASLLLPIEEAVAKDGAYGILEGRTASMMHPLTMLALFGTSIYSANLGLKWRQLREIGGQIKDLAAIPEYKKYLQINEELAGLPSGEDSKIAELKNSLYQLQNAQSIETQISELTASRKSLQGMNLKDKHHLTGSVLLGVGVMVSILGTC